MTGRIFTSDTVYQRQRRARKREEKLTTRLGQSIVIDAPDPSEFFTVKDDYSVFARRRILMVNRDDLPENEQGPGSWVVTISAEIEEYGAASGVLRYAPLVALVTYGTGETQTTIEVDAWRSTFAVPADVVSIDIGYTRLGTAEYLNVACPGQAFERVRVDATIHRSLETGESIPTRSYPLIFWLGGTTPELSHYVPVPSQSVAWGVWYGRQVLPGVNDITAQVLSGTVAASPLVVDSPTDDEVSTLMQRMCFRPLHPQSQFAAVSYNGSGPPGLFTLTYQIGF